MQSLLEKNENKNLTFIFYNFLHLDQWFELEMTIFVMWNCTSLDETIHDLFKWAIVHGVGSAHN